MVQNMIRIRLILFRRDIGMDIECREPGILCTLYITDSVISHLDRFRRIDPAGIDQPFKKCQIRLFTPLVRRNKDPVKIFGDPGARRRIRLKRQMQKR